MQLSGPNFVYHPQYFLCAVGKVFISDLFDSLSFMLREKKNLVIYTIQILAYSFISLTLWCAVF